MTRYILNYTGGSKGDFLCNYINFEEIKIEDNSFNRSQSHSSYFKNLVVNNFSYDLAEIFLRNNNKTKIFPCHRADKITKFFLNENDIKIIQMKYDLSNIKTVLIEGTIKNNCRTVNYSNSLRFLSLHDNVSSDINLIKKIKYSIDIDLLNEGYTDINDNNRIKYFDIFFQNINNKNFLKEKYFNINYIDTEINFFYRDLFVEKNFEALEQLFDINSTELSDLIEKTWLPSQFEFCGKIWNLEDYGYRNFN